VHSSEKKSLNYLSEIDKDKLDGQFFQNIETSVERKKLKDFLAAGIEKPLNMGGVSASDIIDTAKTYLGVPHCMGGTSRKCIDCSGLLVKVFAQFGITLPHSSEEQATYGKILSADEELRMGDLVFFMRTYKTHKIITHSGIYIGDNLFIHTSSQSGVTISSLKETYWNKKFIFGTRILRQ
jgi:cell wall-associated NlpC family hydrolase